MTHGSARSFYLAGVSHVLQPWASRELPFGRPAEEMPVLLERLLGTPNRLFGLLRDVPPERVQLRLQGKWSVLEHIGHLLVMQDRMRVRVEDWQRLSERLTPIDLADQAPYVEATRQRDLGDVLEEFRLTRNAFVRAVSQLPRPVLGHFALHPCLERRMRPMDMCLYLAEHDDHHLATVRRIVQAS